MTISEYISELERLVEVLKKIEPTILAFKQAAGEHPFGPFISGHIGKRDQNGLPEYVMICPEYGCDFSIRYKKCES